MVDCVENLQTGAEMLVQLRVYILAEAFRSHRPATSSDDARSIFNEGQETLDEQSLRERKASLLHLFKAISLNPKTASAFSRGSDISADISDHNSEKRHQVQKDKGKKKATIETVGEADDPSDGDNEDEELSEGQLNMIYKKFVSGVPDTF